MRLKQKNIRILFLILMFPAMLSAQKDLKIHSIFDKYGKQKGAVMVVLSGKTLKAYKLDKYRSLSIHYDQVVLSDIQACIEADKQDAHRIKEVITNGIVSSGYYQLNNEGDNADTNRYILFKIDSNHKATLIYMEGGLESEELIEKLFLKQK